MFKEAYNLAWIVVEVESGIPSSVKIFGDRRAADAYEQSLRKRMNLENDETGIFVADFDKQQGPECIMTHKI